MKLSELILEEFKAQSKLYEDIVNNHNEIGETLQTIRGNLADFVQDYKDALYMEEQIEKN